MLPSVPPPTRAATQELALLISRMQASADQVERDILETQKKLQQVRPMQQAASRPGGMGIPVAFLAAPGVPAVMVKMRRTPWSSLPAPQHCRRQDSTFFSSVFPTLGMMGRGQGPPRVFATCPTDALACWASVAGVPELRPKLATTGQQGQAGRMWAAGPGKPVSCSRTG